MIKKEIEAPIIKGKPFRVGNGYALRVPKALIDTHVLEIDEEYEFVPKPTGKRINNLYNYAKIGLCGGFAEGAVV